MRALGYTRVSTDEQVAGNGLEVQEQAIRQFCKQSQLHRVDILTDAGISGSNGLESRLGLMTAMKIRRNGSSNISRLFVLRPT